MLLQLDFISCQPRSGLGDYGMPSMHVCACVCVFLTFLHQPLYISFIFEDSFTKFVENVYGWENMYVKKFVLIKKHGHHSQLLENH